METMLLQIDDNRDDWLKFRGPYLSLVGAIDDATGEVAMPYSNVSKMPKDMPFCCDTFLKTRVDLKLYVMMDMAYLCAPEKSQNHFESSLSEEKTQPNLGG